MKRVIISVNSFFSSHFSQFIDDYSGPLNLQLFVESSENEEEKLGALGALNLLFSELNITGPVFITGGDNLSNFDLLRKEVLNFIPNFSKLNELPVYKDSLSKNLETNFISEEILIKELDYFYTNSISRASKTMSECRQINKSSKKTGTDN